MRLIIGGQAQGKLTYAIEKYGLDIGNICDSKTDDVILNDNLKCINNYHLLVKKLLDNGEDPLVFTRRIMDLYPDIIIIMNEVGNGIVPLEKNERVYREFVGRTGCLIASQADTVERIVCGIAVVIKEM